MESPSGLPPGHILLGPRATHVPRDRQADQMLTPGTVGSGLKGQVVRLHAKKNPQWAPLVPQGPGSSESGFKKEPVEEAEGHQDSLGLLTCLESRILKSGKSRTGMRAVTARGMTSVHQ